MHWPGLLVLFPIASQHAASWQDMQQGGALPLALPDGTAQVASRLCIHAGNAGKSVYVLCCAVLCCAVHACLYTWLKHLVHAPAVLHSQIQLSNSSIFSELHGLQLAIAHVISHVVWANEITDLGCCLFCIYS